MSTHDFCHDEIKYKRVAFLGIGRSTCSAYKFLLTKGFDLIIWDDSKDVRNTYKSSNLNIVNYKEWNYEQIDFIVTSPGIALFYPKAHPIIFFTTKHNVEIITDIELFQKLFKDYFYIGITGSSGKSTCVSLIANIFSNSGKSYALAGNIGVPIFDFAGKSRKDFYLLEISSFQLSLFNKVKFNIAAILNITPNHDSYHGGYNNYVASKLSIFKHQTPDDHAIINSDQSYMSYITPNFSKAHVHKVSVDDTKSLVNKNTSLLELPSFAKVISKICGVSDTDFAQGVTSFKGLKHRMSVVTKNKGITYINDSKATTALAASLALRSFHNIYWLLGGIKKVEGLNHCYPYLHLVKQAFIFGKDREKFQEELLGKVNFSMHDSLKSAILSSDAKASAWVKKGEVATVLLSPIGSSFDEFASFEERGDFFIKMITEIVNAKS